MNTLADLACYAAVELDDIRLQRPDRERKNLFRLALFIRDACPEGAKDANDVKVRDLVVLWESLESRAGTNTVEGTVKRLRAMAERLESHEYHEDLVQYCLNVSRHSSSRGITV